MAGLDRGLAQRDGGIIRRVGIVQHSEWQYKELMLMD